MERPFIAVSGGSTPTRLFQLLAEGALGAVPWQQMVLFQVDERCVPPADANSNWRVLHETLLSRIPGIRAYRIEAEREDAAERYEQDIRRLVPANPAGIPQFDAVLLGMGADGHTASLFPGTAALDEDSRFVVRNYVPKLDAWRVTLTFPILNAASHRWFLVSGADKADAFRRVRNGELPAARVRDPIWFVDPEVTS